MDFTSLSMKLWDVRWPEGSGVNSVPQMKRDGRANELRRGRCFLLLACLHSHGRWLCPTGVIFQHPYVSKPLWVMRMLTLVQSLTVNTGIDTVSSPRLRSDCTTLQHGSLQHPLPSLFQIRQTETQRGSLMEQDHAEGKAESAGDPGLWARTSSLRYLLEKN